MAEEMSAEDQAAALEGFFGNPTAVAYAKGHSAALQDVVDVGAKLDEELRELLSYCLTRIPGAPIYEGDCRAVWTEVAERLSDILDGEK